jgi:hypothetical protein
VICRSKSHFYRVDSVSYKKLALLKIDFMDFYRRLQNDLLLSTKLIRNSKFRVVFCCFFDEQILPANTFCGCPCKSSLGFVSEVVHERGRNEFEGKRSSVNEFLILLN